MLSVAVAPDGHVGTSIHVLTASGIQANKSRGPLATPPTPRDPWASKRRSRGAVLSSCYHEAHCAASKHRPRVRRSEGGSGRSERRPSEGGSVGRVGSRVTPHMLAAAVNKLVSLLVGISLTELLMKRRPAPGSIAIRCRLKSDSEADEPGDGGGDVSIKSGLSGKSS